MGDKFQIADDDEQTIVKAGPTPKEVRMVTYSSLIDEDIDRVCRKLTLVLQQLAN